MPKVPVGHVVDEIMLGKTSVKFCDDYYINKTAEQMKKEEIALVNACYRAVMGTMAREEKSKQ